MDPITRLLRKLTRTGRWPLPEEAKIRRKLLAYKAIRDTNREHLRIMAEWPSNRPYKVDSLGVRIVKAWRNYVHGEQAKWTPANDSDAEALQNLIRDARVGDEMGRGIDIAASEGETWWRIYADPEIAPHPLPQFHSRLNVVPLFMGPRLAAVAFVTQLPSYEPAGGTVDRHIEIHAEGVVENYLYRGTRETIGRSVDLGQHPETGDLAPVWQHGLPGILAGRIVNEEGPDPTLGVSEFHDILDQLLDLNEIATIGSENVRLTAKKRVVVPLSALQAQPVDQADTDITPGLEDAGDGSFRQPAARKFDAGEDVLAIDPLNSELGREQMPFQVLEYSFDAEPLIAWKRDLVETACSRRGITLQWLGLTTGAGDGYAATGTALRYRLIPTNAAGAEKRAPWLEQAPRILELMILLDAASTADGGFGVRWADPARPVYEPGEPMPEDPQEEDLRHQGNVTAGIESVEASIRARHPDWTDDQVETERDAIRADRQASAPSLFGTSGGPGQ